eukprot:Em0022g656a
MGFSTGTLKAVVVHVVGIWALSYLYKNFCSEGLLHAVLGTGHSADGRKTIGDMVPKGILGLEVGFLSGVVQFALAVLYAAYLLLTMYRWIFVPSDTVHHYNTRDTGHHVAPGKDMKDASRYIQQVRKFEEIPPPYPNGWYEVMRSCDLPVKAARAVSLLGENFAVYRGEDGRVSIVDAYCPHLGANLGVGGHVRGNCIECPFHGWRFDGETGQCVSIPYTDKIPKSARIKVWPSTECHSLIFVWYDAEGRDPLFPLEEIEEVKRGRWRFRGRSVHYISTHIEDISENGGDMLHLSCVHGANVATGASRGYDEGWFSRLLVHNWKGNWEPKTDSQSHMGCMTINLTHAILGVRVPLLDVSVVTHQIGPALVILRYKTAFGTGTWVQTIVPEGPLYLRMTSYSYTDWWLPTFVASSFLEGMGTQLDRDVNIWASKTYHMKPLFVKEDKILVEHRRWFSQFYSENSKKFTVRRDKDLTW